MSTHIYVYSLKDEESSDGFILVACETEVNLKKSKNDKVNFFHLHEIKNKPHNFTLSSKAAKAKL